VRVVGETVTSALTMDESKMWAPDFQTAAQFVMSPPIRSKAHQEPLRNALANGIISLVATGQTQNAKPLNPKP
jgi:dihydropyrimidinase